MPLLQRVLPSMQDDILPTSDTFEKKIMFCKLPQSLYLCRALAPSSLAGSIQDPTYAGAECFFETVILSWGDFAPHPILGNNI